MVRTRRADMRPPVSLRYADERGYSMRCVLSSIKSALEFSRPCISEYTTPASSSLPLMWYTSVTNPASVSVGKKT